MEKIIQFSLWNISIKSSLAITINFYSTDVGNSKYLSRKISVHFLALPFWLPKAKLVSMKNLGLIFSLEILYMMYHHSIYLDVTFDSLNLGLNFVMEKLLVCANKKLFSCARKRTNGFVLKTALSEFKTNKSEIKPGY